jgi:hypothetical protein
MISDHHLHYRVYRIYSLFPRCNVLPNNCSIWLSLRFELHASLLLLARCFGLSPILMEFHREFHALNFANVTERMIFMGCDDSLITMKLYYHGYLVFQSRQVCDETYSLRPFLLVAKKQ